MGVLSGLEPKRVFEIFEELCESTALFFCRFEQFGDRGQVRPRFLFCISRQNRVCEDFGESAQNYTPNLQERLCDV